MAMMFDMLELVIGTAVDECVIEWLYGRKRKPSMLAGLSPDSIGIWNVPTDNNGTNVSDQLRTNMNRSSDLVPVAESR